MAVDLTSLGGHRLPVQRYGEQAHIPSTGVEEGGVDDALLAETQSAVWARAVSIVESAGGITGLTDTQQASIAGELIPNVDTSVGPHRLPMRRYESFNHIPVSVRAELAVALDSVSAVGVQGVDVVEIASYADTTLAGSVIPDSVVDVLAAEDTVDAGTSRVGALVSTVGPMGMPRQRWVDFIHPAGVEETVLLTDLQDAALTPELVDFVQESAPAFDTISIGGISTADVVDALDLNDFSTTGNTFNGATDEVAPIFDVVDATIEELSGTVNEVNALVDILVVDSIFRNALVNELATLYDVPGVAGELYETVAETAIATAAFDISGAFTPGVNLDGARTIHVEAELREIEVRELEVMA